MAQTLYALLQGMAATYGQAPAYQVAQRLFDEQCRVVATDVQPKANQEISASSLQSLDDLEATYREKNRVGYKGYVANVTETCDPENPLQLITDVGWPPIPPKMTHCSWRPARAQAAHRPGHPVYRWWLRRTAE